MLYHKQVRRVKKPRRRIYGPSPLYRVYRAERPIRFLYYLIGLLFTLGAALGVGGCPKH